MTRTRDKGKGRPRSPSPTNSPHQNSKGEGKSSDDGSAKGTPKDTGVSPSGKANKLPCTNLKKGCCENRHSCNHWHVPERACKAPSECRFGDMCAYKNTAKPADEKINSASIAIHIPSNDERKMQTTENSLR